MRSRSAGWCARRYQRAANNPLERLNGALLEPLRGVVRSFYQPATIPPAGGVPTTPSDIVGIRSPKAVPSSRGCGRRVVPNRRWRRQWRSRRRVAAPRSLAFSGRTAPSNERTGADPAGPLTAFGSRSRGSSVPCWRGVVGDRRGWLASLSKSLAMWSSGGPENVSSACGLARSPSGHFASAAMQWLPVAHVSGPRAAHVRLASLGDRR